VSDYGLEDHERRLLTMAAESWDQNCEARRILKKDGLTFTDDRGNIRAHPAVSIAKDAKTIFARMLRELCLSNVGEPVGRPPSLRR
jgi:phage terminase small subunit